ncbi:protein serine/threonine phosphatase [Emydomyces testavorans]|uniref:Protein phosphatase n=1 Tax=Emydomyces testavorans TaxID=2070801 RepID=A0AAF0DHS3_9EURO|nr:protein serine/threonine phosphatase [Emydomyces testavorans]
MVFNISAFYRALVSSSSKQNPNWLRHGFSQWRAATSTYGISTPSPEKSDASLSKCPFVFETGYALSPKRPSRPFPPPFLSPPSSSFSDPLTTHHRSQDTRPSVYGELIRGLTNGDDAVLVSQHFLGVNDGVGAWATKPHGHAALWSRLIIHFWALEVERNVNSAVPHPVEFLQRAYEQTVMATSSPNEWFGTTTSATALLHYQNVGGSLKPLLYVTNIGDCQILVLRPKEEKVIFRTQGQWHWFDCPMQLGTNSVDRPRDDAALSVVELEEDDIVVALSDGVTDNLWEQDLLQVILLSLKQWESGKGENGGGDRTAGRGGGMVYIAQQLLQSARTIAQDPSAETPYMNKANDAGLAISGGKMDDISVVVGLCEKKPT